MVGLFNALFGKKNKINLKLLAFNMQKRNWNVTFVGDNKIEIQERYWNKGNTYDKLYIEFDNNKAVFKDKVGRIMSIVNTNDTNNIFSELKEICNVV